MEVVLFVVVYRTDTLPGLRALVNTDHIIAVAPVAGGVKSRFTLSNGETWEVSLPFTRAMSLLRAELEIVEPVAPGERRRPLGERADAPQPEPSPASERQRGTSPSLIDRRRPPGVGD